MIIRMNVYLYIFQKVEKKPFLKQIESERERETLPLMYLLFVVGRCIQLGLVFVSKQKPTLWFFSLCPSFQNCLFLLNHSHSFFSFHFINSLHSLYIQQTYTHIIIYNKPTWLSPIFTR